MYSTISSTHAKQLAQKNGWYIHMKCVSPEIKDNPYALHLCAELIKTQQTRSQKSFMESSLEARSQQGHHTATGATHEERIASGSSAQDSYLWVVSTVQKW
jgi:hypothetical protein